MNKYILILSLILLTSTALAQNQALTKRKSSEGLIPAHELVIVVASGCLLALAIFIFLRYQTQPTTIEFTEFNSQYVGKESTRSDSQRQFPNFGVDILKKPNLEQTSRDSQPSELSSAERRRRRKVSRLKKYEMKDNSLDMTPPPYNPMIQDK